jgi:hypothetical protein
VADPSKRTQVLVAALAVLGAVAYFTIGQEERQKRVATTMTNIYDKVATDAEARYGIAKRQGDPIQICVQAGFVSAAWLQAKNEAQYGAWKATEKADCARAGMPRP